MKFTGTTDIAVGVDDIEAARDYYRDVMGFEVGKTGEGWIQMLTGPLKLYLCKDDGNSPMLDFTVEDMSAAEARLTENGAVVVGRSGSEFYVRDKYGLCFCVEPPSPAN